ncbi:MAG: nucleotidyltransferase family protein [Desulfurococcaceae archaeon]
MSIIAAAGCSRRFPWNKLTFPISGEPLISRALRSALESSAGAVILVTGCRRDEAIGALGDLARDPRVVEVFNDRYSETEMGYSVGLGARRALEAFGDSVEGILVAPADAAWIPSVAYDLLIDRHRSYRWKIVVASHMGRRGHPILFDSSLAHEVAGAGSLPRGLKSIVEEHEREVREVEVNHPGVLLDLDSPNDLNRVKGGLCLW